MYPPLGGALLLILGAFSFVLSAILNSQAGYRCTLVPRLPFPVPGISNIHSRPTKKILDQREQISKDQYQFSKGRFASRLMEWLLGLLSEKLDLKNNLDHFCPLWLSILGHFWMEDQGQRNPQIFLVNNFAFLQPQRKQDDRCAFKLNTDRGFKAAAGT